MWTQKRLASTSFSLLATLLSSALAHVTDPLVVKTTSGTFRGSAPNAGVEQWLGIPFAQQPVGNLRFKAPQPITHPSSDIVDAVAFGPACPQPPAATLGAPIQEDCLHMNIYRPQNTTSGSKLPILFWIHGGAWTTNSPSNPTNDPTGLVQFSTQINKPIIFVSINYRLNTFGFLASQTMNPGDLNAGILDQILALNFVQDNIAAFGGDPSKVTIWGQSAGGGSVEAHFCIRRSGPCFALALLTRLLDHSRIRRLRVFMTSLAKPFSRLLTATGCEAGPGAVACLQQVPFATLMNISNAMISATLNRQLWEPTVSPGSIIDVQASQKIRSGNFLHLPYLGGTNLNEGTFFTPTLRNLGLSGAAEDAAFTDFMNGLVIDNSTLTPDVLADFRSMYPANDPLEGAPFNTGDSLFDRASAWYTDMFFLGPRRFWFNHASASQPMFGYHFREFIPGNDPSVGVTHISELLLIFGPLPAVAAVEGALFNQMRTFWLNFVHDLNPGGVWKPYKPGTRQVLQLLRDNVTMIPDTFDLALTDFINTPRVQEEFER